MHRSAHTQVLGYIYSLGPVSPTNLLMPMPSPGFEATMNTHFCQITPWPTVKKVEEDARASPCR